jgi:hypothetical protein
MGENQTEHRNTINEMSLPQVPWVMPECATSLEDNFLLNSLSVEQLSINNGLPLRCGDNETPYCANSEIMVICTANKALLGFVNCSAQHWEQVSTLVFKMLHALILCMFAIKLQKFTC